MGSIEVEMSSKYTVGGMLHGDGTLILEESESRLICTASVVSTLEIPKYFLIYQSLAYISDISDLMWGL